MAIQLVKALGATRVILTGTRASRLAMGRQLGADVVVNSRETDPVAAVMDATGDKGADLVIDCAGGDDTFDQSIKMAKSGGKVLLVAFYHGPVTADVSHAVRRNITIYTERGEGGTSVGRALALLAAGRLTAKPLITHQFPLTPRPRGDRGAREAHRRSAQGGLACREARAALRAAGRGSRSSSVCLAAAPAAAFPDKPLELTVLFGAGSAADLLARKLAELAGKDLGPAGRRRQPHGRRRRARLHAT